MEAKSVIFLAIVGVFMVLILVGMQSGYINNLVVLRDGTNNLTANWDVGHYNITADYFFGNLSGYITGHIDASNITSGVLDLARIPTMNDAHIPDLETLSYGGTFNLAQIPTIPDSKLAEAGEYLLRNGTRPLTANWNAGSFNITADWFLGNLNASLLSTGTIPLARIPLIPDSKLVEAGEYLFRNGSRALTANWDVGAFTITADQFNLNTNEKIQFRDADIYINSISDGHLDLTADVGINLNAPSIWMPIYGSDYGSVLYLEFEEGTGTAAFDQSPYGNDGTISGALWTNGKFGKALDFDGTNDFVNVTDDTSIDITTTITIEMWVNLKSDQASWARLVDKDTYKILFDDTRHTQPYFIIKDGGVERSIGSWDVSVYSGWTLLTATYDGSTLKLYTNGILDATTAYEGDIDSSSGTNLFIGSDTNGYSNSNSTIDEVHIYNRALTAAEIRTHYLNTKGQYSSSIIISDAFRILGTDLATDFSVINGDGTFAGSLTLGGDLDMAGNKIQNSGGVDPPYVSYSNQTHTSIREYSSEITSYEVVMFFWNSDNQRFEYYHIEQDCFYTLFGELIEENN